MAEAPLVPALLRAARMLDLAAAEGAPLRLTDFATRLDLPKSSVHALCQTLVHLRLLREGPEGFLPGPAASRWAGAFDAPADLTRRFHALAAQDPGLAADTMTLSVLDGPEVVYLACRNGARPLGITFRPGMRLPAVYSATGKALLAALPGPECAALLAGAWPGALTPAGVASAAALAEQLRAIRAQGYSVDAGEIRQGMVCLGAAITDAAGHPVAGIALSLTAAEAEAQGLAQRGAAVARLARALSRDSAP